MDSWIAAIAAVVSIFIAIWTWKSTQDVEEQARKKTHTADFLSHVFTSEQLAEASLEMALIIGDKRVLNPQKMTNDEKKRVLLLLNYYNFVCSFYYQQVLDHDVVKASRAGTIKRAYEASYPLIVHWRTEVNAPLFHDLMRFYGDPETDFVGLENPEVIDVESKANVRLTSRRPDLLPPYRES